MAATETHRMLTTFLLIYLCFCTAPISSSASEGGMVIEGSKQEIMMPRKMLMADVADYDETGANSRHEPRRGRSGRNP
ncbi:hypothetical protein LINGRAHAP2_LOCUS33140 [Linum grandiflorum]